MSREGCVNPVPSRFASRHRISATVKRGRAHRETVWAGLRALQRSNVCGISAWLPHRAILAFDTGASQPGRNSANLLSLSSEPGKHSWLVCSLLWLMFHLPFGTDLMIMLMPVVLIVPYAFSRTRNALVGVFIHGIYNGPLFLAVSLGLVE